MTLKAQIRLLSTLTNYDEAGRHFTKRYSEIDLISLEESGLIEINRPVHASTGIDYDQQYWSVEITPKGVDLVKANPAYWVV